MKKKFKLISIIIVLLTMSSTLWGQARKNLVTYTIDGGTFHHQLVTINSNPGAIENGAWSGPGSGYLKINLGDGPADNTTRSKWVLDIAFNHTGTGTAEVNDPIDNTRLDDRVYFLLYIEINETADYLTSDREKSTQTFGTITITKFGPVGGTIEGNFKGTLRGADGIYTITGGHFIVARKS